MKMKLAMILTILLIFIGGCSTVQDKISQSEPTIETTSTVSGIQDLMLNEQDLQQLGMKGDGTDCQIEDYQANEYAPVTQTGMCGYIINGLEDTKVVVQLTKFANLEDLDGAYQYDSLHLYSVEGLISENDFGDKSRFRVNDKNDYMGNLNPPGMYYYHLWIAKDLYLIHITSGGSSEEAGEYIKRIGQQVLSKL